MKITLITPCSRPENIKSLESLLNFEYIHEWIIVYDGSKVSSFEKCENPKIKQYIFTLENSIKGTAQRNFGIDLVSSGYVYFLDDDNRLHPNFYNFLDTIEPGNIYTFDQEKIRLGNVIRAYCIDTAQYLVDFSLPGVKNVKWENSLIHDGVYIEKVYSLHPTRWVYINRDLCYHNFI
jgi:glycosyltransferase involved in cell wall biosynthesis